MTRLLHHGKRTELFTHRKQLLLSLSWKEIQTAMHFAALAGQKANAKEKNRNSRPEKVFFA